MFERTKSELGGLLRQGLIRSIASLVIKAATAGLTYLMFVVLSRAMDAGEYGYFAFGLSLATMLAIAASMGQQTAVLRFYPEEIVAGRPERAIGTVRAGAALTLMASVAVAMIVMMLTAGWSLVSGVWSLHYLAAAVLIVPLAGAEYVSAALRAQGSVWTGLAPRDIFWRAMVPAIVLALALAGVHLAGAAVLLLAAGVLALMLALQQAMARRRGYEARPGLAGLGAYWRRRGRASGWFLLGAAIDSAAVNVDTILVGLLVAPAMAGLYFNAARTAGLMTLFTFAIELVVAPMLARHFHAGEMRKAQAVVSLCAWAGFVFSAVIFAGFWLFGGDVLMLFGNTGAEGWTVLMILSVGYLFEAATGPARIVMVMTGHERAYVGIWGGAMIVGVAAMILTIPLYGVVAAALVGMAVRVFAFTAKTVWAVRVIGLDPSLFGVVRLFGAEKRAARRTGLRDAV